MAVWSHISISDLVGAVRLDAEFWQPAYLAKEKIIRAGRHISLGALVSTFKKGIFYILAREYADHGVPFYRSSNVGEILPKESGLAFITPAKHQAEYKTALVPGDLMMVKTGRSGASVVLAPQCNVSQDVIAVKVRRERVNPYFLALYLNTSFGSSEMNRWFQGQVQPHLSLEDARRIWIALIPDEAQVEIETVVTASAQLRSAAEIGYANAQQLLETELGLDKLTFQKPVGYTARFSEVMSERRANAEYFSPVVKHLLSLKLFQEAKPLAAHFSILRGKTPASYSKQGIAMIKTKAIRTPTIDSDRVSDFAQTNFGLTEIKERDLILASMGVGSLGRMSYVYQLASNLAIDGTLRVLRRKDDSPEDIEVPQMLFLSSKAGQELIYRGIVGSTGIISLPDAYLRRIPLPEIKQGLRKELTDLVHSSIEAKDRANQLLVNAKARVEQLIEEAVLP